MINAELIDVKDIYEDNELVLMKATFGNPLFKIVRTDVGLKDDEGDIVDIITVRQVADRKRDYFLFKIKVSTFLVSSVL